LHSSAIKPWMARSTAPSAIMRTIISLPLLIASGGNVARALGHSPDIRTLLWISIPLVWARPVATLLVGAYSPGYPQGRDKLRGEGFLSSGDEDVVVDEHRGPYRGCWAGKLASAFGREVGEFALGRTVQPGPPES